MSAHFCTFSTSKHILTLSAVHLQIPPSSTLHLCWTTRPLGFTLETTADTRLQTTAPQGMAANLNAKDGQSPAEVLKVISAAHSHAAARRSCPRSSSSASSLHPSAASCSGAQIKSASSLSTIRNASSLRQTIHSRISQATPTRTISPDNLRLPRSRLNGNSNAIQQKQTLRARTDAQSNSPCQRH